MPEIASIYDAWHFQPVVQNKENLALYIGTKWQYYICEYQNPIIPGDQTVVDLIPTATPAITQIAGLGAVAAQLVTIMQMDPDDFIQARFEPLDYVAGQVWEAGGQQLQKAKNIHSDITPMTRQWDPYLASSTFFVYGINHDMRLGVRNIMANPIYRARFQFWGCRMIISKHPDYEKATGRLKVDLELGIKEVVRDTIGPVRFVPAEGRG
jgi:hypothetical protein